MTAVCKLTCHYSLFTSKISTRKDSDFFTNSQDVTAKYNFRLTIYYFNKRCSIQRLIIFDREKLDKWQISLPPK